MAGRLPWTELARRVEGVEGRVPMRFVVAPGTCLNSSSPWAHDTVHGTVFRVHDVTLAVRLLGELETDVGDQAVRGGFTTFRGSRHLVGSPRRRTSRHLDPATSTPGWTAPSPRGSGGPPSSARGPWADDVARSALILKLLLHSPSGSIAAAATRRCRRTSPG